MSSRILLLLCAFSAADPQRDRRPSPCGSCRACRSSSPTASRGPPARRRGPATRPEGRLRGRVAAGRPLRDAPGQGRDCDLRPRLRAHAGAPSGDLRARIPWRLRSRSACGAPGGRSSGHDLRNLHLLRAHPGHTAVVVLGLLETREEGSAGPRSRNRDSVRFPLREMAGLVPQRYRPADAVACPVAGQLRGVPGNHAPPQAQHLGGGHDGSRELRPAVPRRPSGPACQGPGPGGHRPPHAHLRLRLSPLGRLLEQDPTPGGPEAGDRGHASTRRILALSYRNRNQGEARDDLADRLPRRS